MLCLILHPFLCFVPTEFISCDSIMCDLFLNIFYVTLFPTFVLTDKQKGKERNKVRPREVTSQGYRGMSFLFIIIIIIDFFAPISSKIKLSGATKPRY